MEDLLRMIGYSIRNIKPIHLRFHKPGARIISMDQMLFPDSDLMDKFEISRFGYSVITKSHSDLGIFSSFELLKTILKKLENKSDYGIFGYALSEKDLEIISSGNFVSVKSANTDISSLDNTIDFRFCGYDVMELDGYISTLLNCEKDWKLAEESGPLNEFGLFSDYSDAQDYAERCKILVPEHSPCVVWGIWQYFI